jgi:hypothetical protein
LRNRAGLASDKRLALLTQVGTSDLDLRTCTMICDGYKDPAGIVRQQQPKHAPTPLTPGTRERAICADLPASGMRSRRTPNRFRSSHPLWVLLTSVRA